MILSIALHELAGLALALAFSAMIIAVGQWLQAAARGLR
jgi:hypothetical protein